MARDHRLPGGTLRVHPKTGAHANRVVFIPVWCTMIAKSMTRGEAATALRELRRLRRST